MSRGILFSLAAQVLFIIGAYAIHIYSGKHLGPELYGVLGVVLNFQSMTYVLLSNGIRQSVSRAVSRHPEHVRIILSKGLFCQCVLAASIASAIAAGAGPFSEAFGDPTLKIPMRICAAVVFVQAIQFVYQSTLNGLRDFFRENLLVGIYSTVRPAAAIALLASGWGVEGVIMGFFVASLCAVGVGMTMFDGLPGNSKSFQIKELLLPAIPSILIFGFATFIMNIDLFFVKRICTQAEAAGLYTAASALAKPVYFFLYPFGTVALPVIADHFHRKKISECRKYISQVLRFSIILFIPIVVFVGFEARKLLVTLYTKQYAEAHSALALLTIGMLFLGIFSIAAHVLIALGQEKPMAGAAVAASAANILLNFVFIHIFGLMGAAMSFTLTALLMAGVSLSMIMRTTGLNTNLISIGRMALAASVISLVINFPLLERFPLVASFSLLYSLFFFLLILTDEIGRNDLAEVKRILSRFIGS